jgi:hypothetical protein
MTTRRDRTQQGQFVTLVVAAVLESIYLVALLARNVSALRDARTHWARDLARESGMAGVVWIVLAVGVAALSVTLLARRQSMSLFLAFGIMIGCLGLESVGLVERRKFDRMIYSMTSLRQTGLKILEESKSSTGGLPLNPPAAIVAQGVFRDGWGHTLRYVRISPNHAFLIAPGSDGRIAANVDAIKREVFPPSRFDHDIIVEILGGAVSFTVYPDGPAQGVPCAIYSAFGCFSYWR